MYKIEKLGTNCIYVKFLGNLPEAKAKKFVEDFNKITKKLDSFCVLVDLFDAYYLNMASVQIILDLLKKKTTKS